MLPPAEQCRQIETIDTPDRMRGKYMMILYICVTFTMESTKLADRIRAIDNTRDRIKEINDTRDRIDMYNIIRGNNGMTTDAGDYY